MLAQEITEAAVAGAGTMGTGLALILAEAGLNVALWNRSGAGLERARARMAASGADAEALGRIAFTTETACFARAQFVLESVTEDLELKRDFYRRIDPLLPEESVLCSNTSGLSVTALAEGTARPERFCGMHWINPPALIPLVEVVRGEKTAPETAELVCALALRLGKKPICCRDVPGFVLNRLQFALLREALYLVDSGAADAEDVDGAVKYGLGLRYACLGPFETADLGGLDVFAGIADYLFADLCGSRETPPSLAGLRARGDLGVKTGRGFYDYPDGAAARAVSARDAKLRAVCRALFG